MRKFILEDKRDIAPFNEPARELSVLNKPLWLAQRDALAPYCNVEFTIPAFENVPRDNEESIVYRDNLFLDDEYIAEFHRVAKSTGRACRAAFSADDKAMMTYAHPLAKGFEEAFD